MDEDSPIEMSFWFKRFESQEQPLRFTKAETKAATKNPFPVIPVPNDGKFHHVVIWYTKKGKCKATVDGLKVKIRKQK